MAWVRTPSDSPTPTKEHTVRSPQRLARIPMTTPTGITRQRRGATMKAIVQDVYGTPDILRLDDVDVPAVGPEDVLVQVRAAGVDAGVWHLMEGQPYLMRVMGFGLRGPKARTRGQDVAGVVAAVGAQVTVLRPGDEVFGTADGSFAEYATTRADRLAVKPSLLDFEQAAVIPTSGVTALQALRRADVGAGTHVLVIGAGGGVGTFAVQLAKALGAEVTGCCSTSKVDLVRSIGADHVIDHTQEEVTAGGRRYDAILDLAGNRPLPVLREALTPRGRLVIVGGEDGGRWLGGMQRVLGATLLSPFVSQSLTGLFATIRAADLRHLAELAESGKVVPVMDRIYALHEAADAIRHVHTGRARGKVSLSVDTPG